MRLACSERGSKPLTRVGVVRLHEAAASKAEKKTAAGVPPGAMASSITGSWITALSGQNATERFRPSARGRTKTWSGRRRTTKSNLASPRPSSWMRTSEWQSCIA